jgi:hypothetical protein
MLIEIKLAAIMTFHVFQMSVLTPRNFSIPKGLVFFHFIMGFVFSKLPHFRTGEFTAAVTFGYAMTAYAFTGILLGRSGQGCEAKDDA